MTSGDVGRAGARRRATTVSGPLRHGEGPGVRFAPNGRSARRTARCRPPVARPVSRPAASPSPRPASTTDRGSQRSAASSPSAEAVRRRRRSPAARRTVATRPPSGRAQRHRTEPDQPVGAGDPAEQRVRHDPLPQADGGDVPHAAGGAGKTKPTTVVASVGTRPVSSIAADLGAEHQRDDAACPEPPSSPRSEHGARQASDREHGQEQPEAAFGQAQCLRTNRTAMPTTAAALPLTTASNRQSTRSTCECHRNRIPSARAARRGGGPRSRGRAPDRAPQGQHQHAAHGERHARPPRTATTRPRRTADRRAAVRQRARHGEAGLQPRVRRLEPVAVNDGRHEGQRGVLVEDARPAPRRRPPR